MDGHEEVWVESPADILRRLTLLPSRGSTFGAKVNALTRLLIVVVVVLAVLKWKHWPVVLAAGIFLILFLYLLKEGKVEIEHFDEDMNNLRHYKNAPTTPLSQLYVQGACEVEILTPTEEIVVVPVEEQKAPSSRPARIPAKIRRPKTMKTGGTQAPKRGNTAYDLYQATFDYEREHGPHIPSYDGAAGFL